MLPCLDEMMAPATALSHVFQSGQPDPLQGINRQAPSLFPPRTLFFDAGCQGRITLHTMVEPGYYRTTLKKKVT